jgi:hypothetical protein
MGLFSRNLVFPWCSKVVGNTFNIAFRLTLTNLQTCIHNSARPHQPASQAVVLLRCASWYDKDKKLKTFDPALVHGTFGSGKSKWVQCKHCGIWVTPAFYGNFCVCRRSFFQSRFLSIGKQFSVLAAFRYSARSIDHLLDGIIRGYGTNVVHDCTKQRTTLSLRDSTLSEFIVVYTLFHSRYAIQWRLEIVNK